MLITIIQITVSIPRYRNCNVDNNNPNYSSDNGVLFNKNKTTLISYPRGKTGEYIIPSSVKSIGEAAFNNCHNLSSVTIPSSVTSIEEEAFWGCSKLSSITIPSSVKSIEYAVFSWCTSLNSIDIPSSVESIGDWAFNSCHSLNSITIPSSVKSIGEKAFQTCTGLQEVTVNWATPMTVNSNIFQNVTTSGVRLIVPKGSKAAYSAAAVWSGFKIEEPSNIFTIKNIPLSLYPNPVIDELKINTDSKINSVQVIDITGKMVYSSFVVNNNSINVSALPSGVYLVKIDTDKGTKTERVVKN